MAVPPLLALAEAGHRPELVVTRPDRRRGRGARASPSPVREAAAGARRRRWPTTCAPCGVRRGPGGGGGLRPHRPGRRAGRGAHGEPPLLAPAALAGGGAGGAGAAGRRPDHRRLRDAGRRGPGHRAGLRREEVADRRGGRPGRAASTGWWRWAPGCWWPLPARGPLPEPRPAGRASPPTPRSSGPAELRLDWERPAAQLGRVVRLGRAWTTFRGRRLRVLRAAVEPGTRRPSPAPRRPSPAPWTATRWPPGTAGSGCSTSSPRAGPPWRPRTGSGAPARRRGSGWDVTADRWDPGQYEPVRGRAPPAVRRPAGPVLAGPRRHGGRPGMRHGPADRRAAPGAVGAARTTGVDSSPPCWPAAPQGRPGPGLRAGRPGHVGRSARDLVLRQRLVALGGRPPARCWPGFGGRLGPAASSPSRCRPTSATPRTGWPARWRRGWATSRRRTAAAAVLAPERYAELLDGLGAAGAARPPPGLRPPPGVHGGGGGWVSGTLLTAYRAADGRPGPTSDVRRDGYRQRLLRRSATTGRTSTPSPGSSAGARFP